MKSNITIICQLNTFKKRVAKALADKLDLYYVDVLDFMEFNLINLQEVLSTCGVEYLNKIERKTIKEVASFENTVITCETGHLSDKDSVDILKNSSYVVFLRFDKEFYVKQISKCENVEEISALKVGEIVFDETEKHFEEVSDIVIDMNNLSERVAVKKIAKQLNEYFK